MSASDNRSCTPVQFAHSPLCGDVDVDVCCIGGGLAGLSTAYRLIRGGKRVAVVSHGALGPDQGVTLPRWSSWPLYITPGSNRRSGKRKLLTCSCYGEALSSMGAWVHLEKIDCRFERVDFQRWSVPTRLDPGFQKAVVFDPNAYLNGLASAIKRRGGHLHCSWAAPLVLNDHGLKVEMSCGSLISTRWLILADGNFISSSGQLVSEELDPIPCAIEFAVSGFQQNQVVWEPKDRVVAIAYRADDAVGDASRALVAPLNARNAAATENELVRLEAWAAEHLPAARLLRRCFASGRASDWGRPVISRDAKANVLTLSGELARDVVHSTLTACVVWCLVNGWDHPLASYFLPDDQPRRSVLSLGLRAPRFRGRGGAAARPA